MECSCLSKQCYPSKLIFLVFILVCLSFLVISGCVGENTGKKKVKIGAIGSTGDGDDDLNDQDENTEEGTEDPPILESVVPDSGHGGDLVHIYGANFLLPNEDIVVFFADAQAVNITVTSTELAVIVPARPDGSPERVDVMVRRGEGDEVILADAFRYQPAEPCVNQPEVDSVLPNLATTGDIILLEGSNFSEQTVVSVGNKSAVVTFNTATNISIVMPDFDDTCYDLSGCSKDLVVRDDAGCGHSYENAITFIITDSDGDQISDWYEQHVCMTSPLSNDSDGDGLTDYVECITAGSRCDQNDPDSDDDGVGDLTEWNFDHNTTPESKTCREEDNDGDGESGETDCDDANPGRFHGNNDPFDGVDRNCVIDFKECDPSSIVNENTDPDYTEDTATTCIIGGYPLRADLWHKSPDDENSFCMRPTIEPGNDPNDEFIGASIKIRSRRYKDSEAGGLSDPQIFPYESAYNNYANPSANNMNCGAALPYDPPDFELNDIDWPFATTSTRTYNMGTSSKTLCEFELDYQEVSTCSSDDLFTTNFVKMNRITGSYKYKIESEHDKLRACGHSASVSVVWRDHYPKYLSSCKFGD